MLGGIWLDEILVVVVIMKDVVGLCLRFVICMIVYVSVVVLGGYFVDLSVS